jgi:DNA-binding XRE family transcriptional regulator
MGASCWWKRSSTTRTSSRCAAGRGGAVCVDEAHLLGSSHRGATLESLITTLLTQPAPARLVLLSATLSDLERLQAWLAPCDAIRVSERCPPLRKQVVVLEEGEDASEVVAALAKDTLRDPGASVLVFVYQTRSTERLAARLREQLGLLAGSQGPLAYHAQMSLARREAVRAALYAGQSKCIVTTTALGLGVNLPATHVMVRDTTFPGIGPLGVGEVLHRNGWHNTSLRIKWTVDYAIGIVQTMKGQELRDHRARLGVTQAQLADRLGVTANALARWERGERRISEPVARLVRLLVQLKGKPKARRSP